MCYSNESNKPNIIVITHPFTSISGKAKVKSLIDVLMPISNEIFMISGDFSHEFDKKIHTVCIKGVNQKESIFIWSFKQILIQLRVYLNILKTYKNIDIAIFYLGARTYLLPLLLAKMLGIKTIVIVAGSGPQITRKLYAEMLFGIGGEIISRVSGVLENLTYTFSSRIILYSENLIKEWNLEKHKNKICIAHEHFLDFDKFKIKKRFDERDNLVGYMGRLSEEKGVINFVKAISSLKDENIKFLVVGGGGLRNKIERYLEGENLNDKVKLPGWVPREEFLTYLNELKLFVLPSSIEGLPHALLEAMACGTPVLATPVGAIPDVIKDGETGFIMENNSPECITENIVRALAHPNINEIIKNARALVEEKYNYQVAVGRYRIILSSTFE